MGLCNDKTAKATRYSAWGLKNLHILPENLARFLVSRRKCCWGYLSIFENTLKKRIHTLRIHLKIFSLKVVATLLSGSRKGAGGVW